jgi:hypothetical protein
MQYSPYHPWRKYTLPLLDPLSTTAAALATLGGGSAATGGAMALTGVGAGISAANTLAGGDYAAQIGRAKQAEANFEADQDVSNAAGEIASAQRQAINVNQKADLQAPRPDEDRAVVARADDLMRSDPGRYWADIELQDAAFEARERLDGAAAAEGTSPPSPRASQDQRRIEEIEALLRDPSGDGQRRYWTDAGLRTDYAEALARVHGGIGSADGESADAAPATSESVAVAP